nr:MAG TPA: hypothetical protein [Caudoviricetes sp.]
MLTCHCPFWRFMILTCIEFNCLFKTNTVMIGKMTNFIKF